MYKAILFATAIASAGCASTVGAPIPREQLTSFQKGITTEAEVVRALGPARSSSYTSTGTRTLVYSYASYSTNPETFIPIVGLFAGGSKIRSSTTIFQFDSKGLLESYHSSDANFDTKLGQQEPPAQLQQPEPR